MKSTHEEVDIIVQQMLVAANQMSKYVLSDDTDVFVLLLYFCFEQKFKFSVLMESQIAALKPASLSSTT